MNPGPQLCFIQSRTLAYEIVLSTFRISLPTSVKHLWKCPHRPVHGDFQIQAAMERTISAGFAMSPQVALGENHLLGGSAKLCRRHLLWTKLPFVANVSPPGLALKAVCGGLR